MERAVTSIDFPKESIQPKAKIAHYERLLKQDIDEFFGSQELVPSGCPTSDDAEVVHSFTKLGMTFNQSKTLGNYYISPRPNIEALKKFYANSQARHFWLTDIWESTKDQREKTVIAPLFDWIEDRVGEFFKTNSLVAVEFLPNHFGYEELARRRLPNVAYKIFCPYSHPPEKISLSNTKHARSYQSCGFPYEKFENNHVKATPIPICCSWQ